jgi:cell division septation protein DedD
MANYERDKDDVRVYDGSEDDEDGEGSHLPVVIIIAILVLAAFGGVVWLAYNQGVARGRNDPVRIASAEGANAGAGIKVYQQPAGAEDEDVPPPARSDASPVPPPAARAAPAATTVAQANPPTAAPPPVATHPPAQLGLAHPAPEATTPPPKPVATTQPKLSAPPKAIAATQPKPAATPKAAAAAPPKPVATAKPAAGAYLLQIGAYKSEDEALAAWKTYQAKHAALLAGFSPDVQKADLGEKGTWYRLRISSFADKDAALALCERLKSQNGACFLAR